MRSWSGAIPATRVLTAHPITLNGFDFGTGSTGIAPDRRCQPIEEFDRGSAWLRHVAVTVGLVQLTMGTRRVDAHRSPCESAVGPTSTTFPRRSSSRASMIRCATRVRPTPSACGPPASQPPCAGSRAWSTASCSGTPSRRRARPRPIAPPPIWRRRCVGPSADQARSKRSRFMTLTHAATKSRTNLSPASLLA